MKKASNQTLLTIVIIIAFLVCGCSETAAYSVLLCGHSDTVKSIDPKLEFTWQNDPYIDDSRSETIAGIQGKLEYSGTYLNSEIVTQTSQIRHNYIDDREKRFELDDSGFLLAYFWGESDTSDEIMTQDQCERIARDFIEDTLGISLNDYEERIGFNEKSGIYSFDFVKTVRGIDSLESVSLMVCENGSIYNYRSCIIETIVEEKVPEFDLDQIRASVNEKLDDICKNAKKKYDSVEYTDYKYYLSYLDEKGYIIICSVDVLCRQNSGAHVIVDSENLQFVVQL